MLVGWTGQRSATEHKSLQILVRKPVARLRPKNHFATLPINEGAPHREKRVLPETPQLLRGSRRRGIGFSD